MEEMGERRTKILVTLGPATMGRDVVKKLVREGADGFRINFSHGDPSQWSRMVSIVKEVEKESGEGLPIVGDLQGPNIRLGVTTPRYLAPGNEVVLVNATKSDDALPVPIKAFFSVLEKGDRILIADGQVVLEVTDTDVSEARARVLVPGSVGSRKSISVEGKQVPMPFITEKDKADMKFAVDNGFSYILLSFVEKAYHIELARRFLDSIGGAGIGLIAKIETRKAVDNVEDIVEEADGVVVARGDLGTHFPLEKLPSLQRRILRITRKSGKLGILATQLLSSMLDSPVPSRSDVVDIYNGVIQGADVMMLTNETAIGKYPVESVTWLRRVIFEAERELEDELENYRRQVKQRDNADRFAKGIVELAESLSSHIIVYSKSGKTALLLSRFRPTKLVYVGTSSIETARRIRLLWGARPLLVEASDYEEGLEKTRDLLTKTNVIGFGETIIETYRISSGETHFIRIVQVK